MNLLSRSMRAVRSSWTIVIGLGLLALAFSALPSGYFVNLRYMYLSYGCPFPIVDFYLDAPGASASEWREWYVLLVDWLIWMTLLSVGSFAGFTLSRRGGWRLRPRMLYTLLAPLAFLSYAYFYRQVLPVVISVYWLDPA